MHHKIIWSIAVLAIADFGEKLQRRFAAFVSNFKRLCVVSHDGKMLAKSGKCRKKFDNKNDTKQRNLECHPSTL